MHLRGHKIHNTSGYSRADRLLEPYLLLREGSWYVVVVGELRQLKRMDPSVVLLDWWDDV